MSAQRSRTLRHAQRSCTLRHAQQHAASRPASGRAAHPPPQAQLLSLCASGSSRWLWGSTPRAAACGRQTADGLARPLCVQMLSGPQILSSARLAEVSDWTQAWTLTLDKVSCPALRIAPRMLCTVRRACLGLIGPLSLRPSSCWSRSGRQAWQVQRAAHRSGGTRPGDPGPQTLMYTALHDANNPCPSAEGAARLPAQPLVLEVPALPHCPVRPF